MYMIIVHVCDRLGEWPVCTLTVMTADVDTNEAIWKSEEHVRHWVTHGGGAQEQRRLAQWRLMGELLPVGNDEGFTFADLGAGTGGAARAILDLYPSSKALLGEYSEQMMAAGEKAMEGYAGRFRYVELDLMSASWPAAVPADLTAVVTSQCVHHLPDERKAALFGEIHEHLAPGGWYLNFDPVQSEDETVTAAWKRANDREDPESTAKAEHRGPEELKRHANHVRHISPLKRQLGFLRDAGFAAIDVYWKRCDMVIFGGQRPPV